MQTLPMPRCKPPKKEISMTEYKSLKKMLTYFKEEHDKSNQALRKSGDSAYCPPFRCNICFRLKRLHVKRFRRGVGFMSMIEQYFSSKDKLYNRVYQILNVLEDKFSYGDYYYNKVTSVQNTEKSLVVDLVYQEPYEEDSDTKRFILPNDLFTEEFSEEKIISFWKDYIKQEEIFEIKHTLEKLFLD